MIHDPAVHLLGKKAAVHPKGMKMLIELTHSLPEPPPAVGWYKGTPTPAGLKRGISSWNMNLNDKIGDCTIAGISHLITLWTTLTGSPVIPTDAQVVAEYSRLTGYDPKDPNTDQGGVESDILKAWQTTGIFGHKIDGFVGVNPKSQVQVKDAIWFFGGAYIGLALPNSAQDQTVWDVPPGGPVGDGEPNSWGGHCVPIVAADLRYVVCVTWGALQLMTWQYLSEYCDECYGILSPDWIDKSGMTPGGVPLVSLRSDLQRLTKAV